MNEELSNDSESKSSINAKGSSCGKPNSPVVQGTKHPFLKSIVCGIVLYIPFFIGLVYLGFNDPSYSANFSYHATYTFMNCIVPAFIAGFLCFIDKKSSWDWSRLAITTIVIFGVLNALRLNGSA